MTDSHPTFSDRALELIAHRFKLLSEPMRLRLLRVLMDGERSVKDLVLMTNATQANVSKHLGILADGGLITRRKVGVNTLYRITDPSLMTMCDLVCRSLTELNTENLTILKSEEQP